MRRIVTGTTADGRSTVISDDHIDDRSMASIWTTAAATPTVAVDHIAVGFEAPPGGASWTTVRIPNEVTMRAALAAGVPGVDPDGWHTTNTTDLVYVASGRVVLALDTGEVELVAGDCVVQQGTRHAWWNRTEDAVQILSVSLSAAS